MSRPPPRTAESLLSALGRSDPREGRADAEEPRKPMKGKRITYRDAIPLARWSRKRHDDNY